MVFLPSLAIFLFLEKGQKRKRKERERERERERENKYRGKSTHKLDTLMLNEMAHIQWDIMCTQLEDVEWTKRYLLTKNRRFFEPSTFPSASFLKI